MKGRVGEMEGWKDWRKEKARGVRFLTILHLQARRNGAGKSDKNMSVWREGRKETMKE